MLSRHGALVTFLSVNHFLDLVYCKPLLFIVSHCGAAAIQPLHMQLNCTCSSSCSHLVYKSPYFQVSPWSPLSLFYYYIKIIKNFFQSSQYFIQCWMVGTVYTSAIVHFATIVVQFGIAGRIVPFLPTISNRQM